MTETKAGSPKKMILRVALFVLIFAVLFSVMLYLFSAHPDQRSFQMIAGFYEEPEDSLDGIYVGSSNCYAFWNPLVAWENYGITVYPYSSGSQPFQATEYLIRETRKYQPNAFYVVNLNSVEADDWGAGSIHNLVNSMPESETKTLVTNYLCDLEGISKIGRLEFRFPWIRTREFWLDTLQNGFFPEVDGLKGTSRYNTYLKTIEDVTDLYIHSDEKADLSQSLVDSLESLLDYCDAEDIRIQFVVVPRAEDTPNALHRINTAREMVEAHGYEVLYLTDDYADLGLDLTQDYYNNKHTNIHGSIKYTNYLTEYLIEKFNLESSKGDPAYSSWDSAWETYYNGVSPAILDVELNGDRRDYTLAAPADLRAEGKEEGIALSWSASDGADGYIVYRKAGYSKPWQAVSDVVKDTAYLDADCAEGVKHYYTVVPVRAHEGENFYGNFSYAGVKAER